VTPEDEAAKGAQTPAGLSLLMARAQDGDRDAYRQLLDAAALWLRAYLARHWSGIPPTEREDVIQETLVTLHRSRATYDPSRPFEAWLAALARHRAADYVRTARRRRALLDGLAREGETFSTPPPNNSYEEPMLAMHLNANLAKLPVGQQHAVRLLRMEELSLKEASARSGLSVAALKVSLHRAIARLRQLMNE
jgi:RNA polymerase sigma-70 factor (ECF subfamily)